MSSLRQLKLGELIKEQLGKLFLEKGEFPPGLLVSISQVKVSSDMQWADVLIQVYPWEEGQRIVAKLQKKVYGWQQELNQKVNIRHTPKLRFQLDKSEQKQQAFEQALDQGELSGD